MAAAIKPKASAMFEGKSFPLGVAGLEIPLQFFEPNIQEIFNVKNSWDGYWV